MKTYAGNHWGKIKEKEYNNYKKKVFSGCKSFVPFAIVFIYGREKVFSITLFNFSFTINFSVNKNGDLKV